MESKVKGVSEKKNNRGDTSYRLGVYAQEFFTSIPLPAWIKTRDEKGEYRMLTVNKSYEDTYGIDSSDYEGQPDTQHWTKVEAKNFNKHDTAAIESGKPVRGYETVLNRRTGSNERLTVIKWPLKYMDSPVGVAGIVVERSVVSDKLLTIILLYVPIRIIKILFNWGRKK